MRTVSALVALCGLAAVASADVRLSEIFIDAPGTDNGQEFVELSGTAGQSLNNIWLLMIEGDGTTPGLVDVAIDLSSFSLGSNGLFLWRDSATVLDTSTAPGIQGPDAGTSINIADFAPDIENGSNTYLLVNSFTGAVGTDLDTNNDGTLDSAPWASVIDGVGLIENDGAANRAYSAQLGFFDWTSTVFNADSFIRGTNNAWYAQDVFGTSPGHYSIDPVENNSGLANAADFCLTPGVANVIPTPGALALVGLGGLMAGRRRR